MARRSRRSGGRDLDRYPEDAPPTDLDRFNESMVDPVTDPGEVSWLGRSSPAGLRPVARARSSSPLFIHAKPHLLSFARPASIGDFRAAFCVRRAVRREVLHAVGVAGKRGIGAGGVRRTANSKRKC